MNNTKLFCKQCNTEVNIKYNKIYFRCLCDEEENRILPIYNLNDILNGKLYSTLITITIK